MLRCTQYLKNFAGALPLVVLACSVQAQSDVAMSDTVAQFSRHNQVAVATDRPLI